MSTTAARPSRSHERGEEASARLALARGVLARAEAGAGLRQRLTGATALNQSTLSQPSETPLPREAADRVPPELVLPAPSGVAELLPDGGLRRGTAVSVRRSTSMLLALAARASADGAWCAVVGMPDLGLAAAAEAGLDLDRAVLVPRPGPDAPAVLAALVDGFDVVVLGGSMSATTAGTQALSDRDRRSLTSRLRTREAVLLVGGDWPGAAAVLEVGGASWAGVGSGDGVLTGREVTVTVRARGVGGPRSARVRMAAAER